AVPLDVPPTFRARGATRRDSDRQRLAAGLRPDRPHAARSGRRRRDRGAHVSARPPGVPLVRRPAPGRAVGRRRAARGRLRASPRPPRAEALLLPAERPQPDGALARAGNRAAAPPGGGTPPGADRRGRLRRKPLLRCAACRPAEGDGPRRRGHLYRHLLEGPLPGAAPRLARRAATGPRTPPRGQAARRPPHERAAPGGGPPVLRAQAPRPPRGARRPRVRA